MNTSALVTSSHQVFKERSVRPSRPGGHECLLPQLQVQNLSDYQLLQGVPCKFKPPWCHILDLSHKFLLQQLLEKVLLSFPSEFGTQRLQASLDRTQPEATWLHGASRHFWPQGTTPPDALGRGAGCRLTEDHCVAGTITHVRVPSYLILTTSLQHWWQQFHLNLNEKLNTKEKSYLKQKIDTICFCRHSNGDMDLSSAPFHLLKGTSQSPADGPSHG